MTRKIIDIKKEAMQDERNHDPVLFAPGTNGCHEALHMSHVLAELVHARLCDHPSIRNSLLWRKLAADAADALDKLYQSISEEHLE